DGCGLSRENHVSPAVIVKVLTYNAHGKNFEAFRKSLAVSGVDGTLANRFHGALKGRVFAKSGYIGGVSALSGYLKTTDDRWYCFSILMNNVPGGAQPKEIHEKILTLIDREKP